MSAHTCQSTATPHHSDDLFAVHAGSTTPTYLCGYHFTYYYPEG